MREAVRRLRDRFVASDPALARWRSGLRALLAALLSSALLLAGARWLGQDKQLALVGIIVSVMTAVSPQDRPRGEQAVTLACIAAVASGVVVLGALVADRLLVSAACFLATIYLAFQAQRFGPRGTAVGTIAYQAYFYAMLLKPAAQRWPWIVLSIAVGCAVAALVRLAVVVQHPQQVLRDQLRAWRAALALLLHDLARSLEPGARPARRRRCDADLARLFDLSLAIERQLADLAADDARGAELRDSLLRHELAAEALVDCVAAARRSPDARRRLPAVLRALDAATRRRDAGALRGDAALRGAALGGDAARGGHAAALGGDAASTVADLRGQARSALEAAPGLRWSCGESVARLLVAPPWAAPLPALREVPAFPSPPEPPARRARGLFSLDERTRRAVQACAAAAGAIVAGRLISADHWYWAVFAAFVLFTQANTREQAVSRAWQRTLANVAGLVLGLVVAEMVQGRQAVQSVLLFVFIAIGFYGFRDVPALYGAVLTAMLAMLYELLGMYRPGVLLLRLVETLAGAAMAAISSTLVLPVRTRDESDAQTVQVLRTAARVMHRGFGAGAPPPARDMLRALDGDLQALRRSLGPVTGSSYPAKKSPHRRRLQRLSRLVFCVRHLYALAAEDRALAGALRDPAQALAAELERGAQQLDAAQDLQAALPAVPPPFGGAGARHDAEPQQLAMRWLREADAITRALRPRNRDRSRLHTQAA